jgi:hypothetical protein
MVCTVDAADMLHVPLLCMLCSFTGASPSATLKRERLRTRNAILRSTGFLEPGQGTATAVPIPAQAAAAGSSDSGSLQVARTPVQSSLTAALTTIGES